MKSFSQTSSDFKNGQNFKTIQLPEPNYESQTSVEAALSKRRSVREYRIRSVSLKEVSQLLWAAQGITDKVNGFRTAPSAGALYPLEVYLTAHRVNDVDDGVYKYDPQNHQLITKKEGSFQTQLSNAALGQSAIRDAAVNIVIAAVHERTTQKYGKRGIRYVHMETGHAAQNVFLQAVSLNLGMVVVGAFNDEKVKQLLSLEEREAPLYILPVGKQ